MKKLPLIFGFVLLSKLLFAQSADVIRNYISTYRNIAIEEMRRTGVPAAITLAQGIHETSAGQSELVKKSNNHFGIKCKTEWTGASVTHDDDARGECFRKYDDPMDSYRDHSDFLKNRPYYSFLFRLDPTDYEAWAYGLKKAGYATNPKYAQILIKLIQDYGLQDYTLIALDRKKDDAVYASTAGTIQSESSSDARALSSGIAAGSYPEGVFKINNTKVVVITKGTSYLKVAEENDLSLARLFEFNDMPAADIAPADQIIFLQRKRKKGDGEFHIMTAGETVYDVAQKEGIRLENLMGNNFLKQGMQPKAGEKLYLRGEAPVMPKLVTDDVTAVVVVSTAVPVPVKPTSSTAVSACSWHIVQPKETMYAIAKKYEVSMADVMKWNNLQSTDLKIGQQLRIYKKTANAN